MYIIASGIYEGILEVNSDNKFQRYFGSTTVSISPLEVFFRMIATEEQLVRENEEKCRMAVGLGAMGGLLLILVLW
jgi:stalled ribosome rescue protein Dom34